MPIYTTLGYTAVNQAGDTMQGDLSMGSHKITNVTDPVAAQDAATMNYVDISHFGSAGLVAVVSSTGTLLRSAASFGSVASNKTGSGTYTVGHTNINTGSHVLVTPINGTTVLMMSVSLAATVLTVFFKDAGGTARDSQFAIQVLF